MAITDYGSGDDPLASPSLSAWAASVASAFALKADRNSPAFTGTPTGITKAHVGLGNVSNLAPADLPVSTATAAAITDVADDVAFLTANKADKTELPVTTRVKLASDVTIISNTTLTNVTGMKLTAVANAEYDVSIILFLTGDPAADASFDITGPSGATLMLGMQSLAIGAAAASGGHRTDAITALTTLSAAVGLLSTTEITPVFLNGWMKTVGTGGDFQLRWKQVASTAVNNVVKAGSLLVATRVA